MNSTLKTATINRNANAEEGRLTLNLIADKDGRYRWYDEEGNDSEVSGDSIDDAITQACSAWNSSDWDFKVAE